MYNLSSIPKTNLDDELVSALMDILPRAMRQLRVSNREQGAEHLKLPQFRVLAHVWREAKTNKELADDIGLSAAAMSRVISGLVKRDLVQRVSNPQDLREARVQITRRGLILFKSIRRETGKKLTKRIQKLNRDEKMDLAQGLILISKILLEPLK